MYFLNTSTVPSKPLYSSFASTSVNEEPEAGTTPEILSTAYTGKVWVANSSWILSELRDSQTVCQNYAKKFNKEDYEHTASVDKKLKNPTNKYLFVVVLCGDRLHTFLAIR